MVPKFGCQDGYGSKFLTTRRAHTHKHMHTLFVSLYVCVFVFVCGLCYVYVAFGTWYSYVYVTCTSSCANFWVLWEALQRQLPLPKLEASPTTLCVNVQLPNAQTWLPELFRCFYGAKLLSFRRTETDRKIGKHMALEMLQHVRRTVEG